MLPTRNRILNLAKRGTLKCTIGLPSQDPNQTMRVYQNIIQRISDPGIFEFSWEHAGILIDTDDLTYYPDIEDAELVDASDYPLPHPHIWIETIVEQPRGAPELIYIWDIVRNEANGGYNARPLSFCEKEFTFLGYEIDFDPNVLSVSGGRGEWQMWCHFADYEKYYDPYEYQDQAKMLGRFMRLLNLPKVRKEVTSPNAALNKERRKQGKAMIATRTVVTIDNAAIVEGLPSIASGAGRTHASPKPHHRRAHLRRMPDGRITRVRECVIGNTDGADTPEPQRFQII